LRWAKSRRRDEGRFRSLVEQLPCVTYECEFDVQAILLKPGRLTPAESDKVKEHTLIGAELLAGGGFPLLERAEPMRSVRRRPRGLCFP
jgi:hypothetical protein